MSVPVLVALLSFIVVVAAVAGVWRARRSGPVGTESSVMLLLVVVAAAVLVWYLLSRRG